jgi:anti-sigma regulatory factor (Ser/Thr protein kinase)
MRFMGPEEAKSACAFGRTVPAVAENVAPLRHAVVELASRHNVNDETKTDLALAVGEACANVVVHAYPPGDVGPLIVHAEIKDGEIHIEICDQGQGMVPRPDSPGLGLGLPLIATLCDDLTIGPAPAGHGTVLKMRFDGGALH